RQWRARQQKVAAHRGSVWVPVLADIGNAAKPARRMSDNGAHRKFAAQQPGSITTFGRKRPPLLLKRRCYRTEPRYFHAVHAWAEGPQLACLRRRSIGVFAADSSVLTARWRHAWAKACQAGAAIR